MGIMSTGEKTGRYTAMSAGLAAVRRRRLGRLPATVATLTLCAVLASSCSPAKPLTPAVDTGSPTCKRTLVGVAHPDDDLFFINPEIQETIDAGCPVTTLYLTAGNDGVKDPQEARNYAEARENGVRKAYAEMADAGNHWTMDNIRVNGRSISSYTLAGQSNGAGVRLTFIRLHDGLPRGQQKESLLRLFEGSRREILPFQGGKSYTQEQLLSMLTALVRRSGAERILTMDHDNASFAYGLGGRVDHSDHGITARNLRKVAYLTGIPLRSYLGYTMTPLKRNLTPAQETGKARIARWYAAQRSCHLTRACKTYEPYKGPLAKDYAQWVLRQYQQTGRSPEPGEIMGDIGRTTKFGGRAPEQCLDVKGSALRAGVVQILSCDGSDAQKWDVRSDGTIRTRLNGGYCLTKSGSVVRVRKCQGSRAEQKWRRTPWKSATWKRAAWKIAGAGNMCLYQHDRSFPRWDEDSRKHPRLGLVSCDNPVQPEFYWQSRR